MVDSNWDILNVFLMIYGINFVICYIYYKLFCCILKFGGGIKSVIGIFKYGFLDNMDLV